MTQSKKKKILLVEDDAAFIEVIYSTLIRAGYDVTKAENGLKAKNIFDQESFDLVISDVKMPGLASVELLSYVNKVRPTPFILMTAYTEMTETEEALNLGASIFMTKPFKEEVFLNEVRKALHEKKTTTMEPGAEEIRRLLASLKSK